MKAAILLPVLALLVLLGCSGPRQAVFPDRAPESEVVVAPRFPAPAVDRTLPNGVRLVLVEEPGLPTFDFAYYVAGGDAVDPAGRGGLGTLAMRQAVEGVAGLSGLQLAEAIEGLGATLTTASEAEWFAFHGRSLATSAGDLLTLFGQVLTAPTFPADELAKGVEREKQALKARRAQPMYLAQRALHEAVFAGCPQGTYDLDEDFLESVGRDELAAHYARAVRAVPPSGALFVALGAFDARQLAGRLEPLLGALPRGEAPAPAPACVPSTTPAVLLVDRPGSAQSALLVGRPVGGFADPRRVPEDLADEVLGGGPSRRLFVRLREELGLTYGAYSSLQRYTAHGLWSASLQTRTERTGRALDELLQVARRLAREGVPDDELAVAQSYGVGSFVLKGGAPAVALGRLAEALRNGQGPDYWTRYVERLATATPAEVAAAARALAPFDEASTIVIVGDAAAVRAQLGFVPAERIREVRP